MSLFQRLLTSSKGLRSYDVFSTLGHTTPVACRNYSIRTLAAATMHLAGTGNMTSYGEQHAVFFQQTRYFAKKKIAIPQSQARQQQGRKQMAKASRRKGKRGGAQGKGRKGFVEAYPQQLHPIEAALGSAEKGIIPAKRILLHTESSFKSPKEYWKERDRKLWYESSPSNTLNKPIFTARGGIEMRKDGNRNKRNKGFVPNLEGMHQKRLRTEGFLAKFATLSMRRHNRGYEEKPSEKRRKYREALRVRAEARVVRETLNYLRGGTKAEDFDWTGDLEVGAAEKDINKPI